MKCYSAKKKIYYIETMKNSLLTILKNRNTGMVEFKQASDKLATIIASEIASEIIEESVIIHTPLKETIGKKIAQEVILIPILRAGIALLPSFMQLFESARVGFLGIKREKGAIPHLYYENIPLIKGNDRIIILDPMVATGGSTIITIEKLIFRGAGSSHITVVGMIGSPEGIEAIRKKFPKVQIKLACIDEGLDEKKYIIPGLGDFGDRY